MRLLDFKIKSNKKDQTLYTFLQEFFAEYTPQTTTPLLINYLLRSDHIYINNKLAKKENLNLNRNDRINVYLDIKSPQKPILCLTTSHIVYEDEYLIIINKPSGLASQSTNVRFESNAYDECRYLLNRSLNLTSNLTLKLKISKCFQYLGLLHRLDKGTSGLLLMTKKRSANAPMTKIIETNSFKKTYIAVVEKPKHKMQSSWEIKDKLIRQRTELGIATTDCVTGGKQAHTLFKVRSENEHFALIEASPQTGRTHQIRYHLSKSGLPIVGDQLYGSKQLDSRLLLHAEKLSFPHPRTNKPLNIWTPMPNEMRRYFP